MANYCSVGIKFYSENKSEIENLHKKFKEAKTNNLNFSNHERDISGFVYALAPEIVDYDCRTEVEFDEIEMIEMDNETLFVINMYNESAWVAPIGLWYELVHKNFPDIKIAYIAEEPGCEYFYKYDETNRFYPETYYVDGDIPTKDGKRMYIEDHYMFSSSKEIYDYLTRILPFKIKRDDIAGSFREKIEKYCETNNELDEYWLDIEQFTEYPPECFGL